MAENKGYVHPEVLVDADWVQAHLNDPQVRLIEVDVNTKAYDEGHIPGAVGFNWQKELQDQVVRAPVSKDQLEQLLSRAGVDNNTTIVLYGDNNNWFAAWTLSIIKYYGHNDVRLLDGGRVKWLADKREITTEVPSYEAKSYHAGEPNAAIRIFRDQILARLGQAGTALVDVRSLASTVVTPGSCQFATRRSTARWTYSQPPIFPGLPPYRPMAPSNQRMAERNLWWQERNR